MRVGRLAGLAVLALVGYDRVVRPWLRGWGATDQERRAPLPGDDLVRGRGLDAMPVQPGHALSP